LDFGLWTKESSRAAKISVLAIAAHSTHTARRTLFSGLAVLFLLGLWTANAAQVRIGPFTNSVTAEADTNVVRIIPISGPVANADGSFTTIGVPLRVTPTADGSITNTLAQNNYLATNAYLGQGIVFRVPLDSGPTVYSMYDLRISGYNTFVTIGGGSNTNPPTFNGITNALGGVPLLSTNLPALTNGFIGKTDATNISQFFSNTSSNSLYSDYTTKIAVLSALGLTNAFATNAAGVSYSGGRIYISTNYDALGTALAIGAAGTNYANGISNAFIALHGLSLTNAFATNAAGVTYSAGRAYISTNYDALGTALAIGAAGTNYANGISNALIVLHGLSLTNIFATNVAGVSVSGQQAFVSTNYDAIGAALAIGAAGTNYTLAASNTLYALHGLSLTNAFATNAAGVTYSGGRVYVSTNYDALGTALAIGAAGTNYTLAASNTLYALHGLSLTNAFATNAAGVTYSGGRAYISTNYDALGAALAIGLQGTNFTVAVSNSLFGQITAGGIDASTATNINNAAAGVISTNGANQTFKFTSSATNIIQGLAQTISDTSSNLLQAKVNTASNQLAGANLSTSNTLSVLKVNATNGFSTNQIISHGYGTNNFTLYSPNVRAWVSNSFLFLATSNDDSVMSINVNHGSDGGIGDINGPQGQQIGWNANGQLSLGDSGGEAIFLDPVSGVTIQDLNSHILSLDPDTGDFTITGGGSFAGLGTGIVGKINSTNGFGVNPTFTNNTKLEADVSFGALGQALGITSGKGTNFLVFTGAGSSPATNGALVWTSGLNCYTNWLNGVILTNNGSAWLMQTNGITLYSLTSSSPIGTYSAVNGALPAPSSFSTAAILPSMVMLGYWSVSNQVAQSNALFTNMVLLATNNYIANNGGFGTNARLYSTRLLWNSTELSLAGPSNPGSQMDFASAAWGEANTNNSSGFGGAILSGATNRMVADGGGLIVGGIRNTLIGGSGNADIIVGGSWNTINGSAGISSVDANFLGGGFSNTIQNVSTFAFLGGGYNNALQGAYAINLGGLSNTNLNDGSVILGGSSNRVTGTWSIAAGRNATVTGSNSFVWSDGTATSSTTNSQFTVSGTNGLYVSGPTWHGWNGTNGGAYFTSNSLAPFSLYAVTNAMPNFSYWEGQSNGILVLIYNSNGVPFMKALWP